MQSRDKEYPVIVLMRDDLPSHLANTLSESQMQALAEQVGEYFMNTGDWADNLAQAMQDLDFEEDGNAED